MIKDIRPALRNFLIADSSISTAVGGDRIFPAILPQDQSQPSIVYNRVSGLGDHHMEGASGLTRPRFQIDAYALTHDLATALADLVKYRLDGFKGQMSLGGSPETFIQVQGVFFDSEREDYQADVKQFRISRDYLVWFEERD